MAKGKPGGHKKAPAPLPQPVQIPAEEPPAIIAAVPAAPPSNLPYPPLSLEEKQEILVLSRYRESFSHADIARVLNEVFKAYNKGCRTRKGVEKFLAKPQEPEMAAG